MADRVPQLKQDEQYPLLKFAGGAGDGGLQPQNPTTQFTPGWSTVGIPKQSWCFRWPEFVSSCWMSLILVGMSFLVFYGLCMGVYKRQPFIIVKCNNNTSKPASDVFYHHIVQKESFVPFMRYSEHLSRMATQYPFLRFNVFFLIDDSSQAAICPRKNIFFNKLIPYQYGIFSSREDRNTKRDINSFQRRYQNVNITIMPLSRYMSTTPLKYKWRMIPISYLPFYARIFTVWQNGGIGIDLAIFNNLYNNRQLANNRRVSAILKQHNDGINTEYYTRILKKIDQEEENAIFHIFYGLVHQILNETRSFFNRTFTFPIPTESILPLNEPLIRTHRNKRDISGNITHKNSTNEGNKNSTSHEDLLMTRAITVSFGDSLGNKYLAASEHDVDMDNDTITEINESPLKSDTNNSGNVLNILENLDNITALNYSEGSIKNISEIPQVVLFYDFTIFSDGIGPPYLLEEALPQLESGTTVRRSSKSTKNGKSPSHLLSIDPEGKFVAAASRLHPFLGHIITAGCQLMPPKLAIQDAILSQCSGLLKDDVYCNSIYVL